MSTTFSTSTHEQPVVDFFVSCIEVGKTYTVEIGGLTFSYTATDELPNGWREIGKLEFKDPYVIDFQSLFPECENQFVLSYRFHAGFHQYGLSPVGCDPGDYNIMRKRKYVPVLESIQHLVGYVKTGDGNLARFVGNKGWFEIVPTKVLIAPSDAEN